jgi:hypothetical protein
MQAWIRISTACDLTCPLCERQHVQPWTAGSWIRPVRETVDGLAGMRKAHLFGLGEPFSINESSSTSRNAMLGASSFHHTHAMRIDEPWPGGLSIRA